MTDLSQYIATKLKSCRQNKGWSLDQTAKETGISKAMLGQIERQESNPTVLTLWKIALGFGTSLSSFLPAEQDADLTLAHQDETLAVKVLQPYNAVLGYEVLHVCLQAHAVHDSCAHEVGVTEDILPLNGQVRLKLDDQLLQAQPREIIRFQADQPHQYINTNAFDVEFYNIVHYGKLTKA